MPLKSTHQTRSATETEALGARLGKTLAGAKLFLFGDLGVGKTTFVRGIGRAIGVRERIKSPTFIYEREFTLPRGRKFFHLDLYRVTRLSPEFAERLRELFADEKATVIVEWSERIPKKILPAKRIEIYFREKNQHREIRFVQPKISLKEMRTIKPSKST